MTFIIFACRNIIIKAHFILLNNKLFLASIYKQSFIRIILRKAFLNLLRLFLFSSVFYLLLLLRRLLKFMKELLDRVFLANII